MKRLIEEFSQLRYMNWFLNIIILLLLVCSVAFVFSACNIADEQSARPMYKKQIVWAVLGVFCYLFFAAYDYRNVRKHSWWLYGLSLVLLVLVLIIGKKVYGARRWLEMGAGFAIQPSELAKLAVIFVLSRRLSRPGVSLGDLNSIGYVVGIIALPMVLIMAQPDLGSAMIMVPIAFLMMFAAGLPMRYVMYLVLAGAVAGSTLVGALFVPQKLGASKETQAKICKIVGVSEYHRDRIMVFINADVDPLGAGWNKIQSEIAVGSGGIWGKGYTKGTQNILGYLPKSVAHTDFIYAVIAEEKGFAGAFGVILLFGALIITGLSTAVMARDKFGRMLCIGITSMLFMHVSVNIAMTIGLFPITGIPLPLLSYGGTFMLVMMCLLGILQSVYIRSKHASFSDFTS